MSWKETGNDSIDRLISMVNGVICGLVDDEPAVLVEAIPEQLHTNIRVQVAPRDFGKVIGIGGKNARALRVISTAMCRKLRLPACVVLVDDPAPQRRGIKIPEVNSDDIEV